MVGSQFLKFILDVLCPLACDGMEGYTVLQVNYVMVRAMNIASRDVFYIWLFSNVSENMVKDVFRIALGAAFMMLWKRLSATLLIR